MASSMSSMRFVMPTTKTFPQDSTPSILAKSWFTTESRTPEVSPASVPRDRQIESSSSNITTWSGARSPSFLQLFSAGAKSSRTRSSEAPTYRFRISGPLHTWVWLGSAAPRARASSRARRVLPQPGGPWRSTPRTWETPSALASAAGSRLDPKTRRAMPRISSSRPPTAPVTRFSNPPSFPPDTASPPQAPSPNAPWALGNPAALAPAIWFPQLASGACGLGAKRWVVLPPTHSTHLDPPSGATAAQAEAPSEFSRGEGEAGKATWATASG
mmetsp:Transcript_66032/g.149030  ORF Transcript_66032/g.149030 Transcript_66032/m.149030 type:complete len:272 (-) Transcript_66032:618-1433(-)